MRVSTDPSLKVAVRAILKSIHIQRQAISWLAILVFALGMIALLKNHSRIFADQPVLNEGVGDFGQVAYTDTVHIDKVGNLTVNGQSKQRLFRPLEAMDELRYNLISQPNTFIDQLTVKVVFDNPLPANTKIQTIAAHGVESTTEKQLDNHTIQYQAIGIGPDATYTIVADLPTGSINWPAWRQAQRIITSLPPSIWVAVAVSLPVIAWIVLIIMFWSRIATFLSGEPKTILDRTPQAVPPALVGIILNGRVSAREVAATILDLANRGYISVFNKGKGHFAFGKRRPWEGLQSFELLLLTQMFEKPSYKATNQDVELSLGVGLFSRRIAKIYLAMYDAATQAGFFERNPAVVHARYRFTGLMLFFLGLLGFTGAELLQLEPSFILFFFAGLMTMALVIIVSADSVPLRNRAGDIARIQWLSFRNYLADPSALGYVEGAQSYYQRFLPYAVVMKEEIAWAKRFENYPFAVPEWYDSVEDTIEIEDFANGLYSIVGSVSELFAGAKEPTVS